MMAYYTFVTTIHEPENAMHNVTCEKCGKSGLKAVTISTGEVVLTTVTDRIHSCPSRTVAVVASKPATEYRK